MPVGNQRFKKEKTKVNECHDACLSGFGYAGGHNLKRPFQTIM